MYRKRSFSSGMAIPSSASSGSGIICANPCGQVPVISVISLPGLSAEYGTEGLRLTLEEARHIVPEEEFYLRVNRDNPASLRVMMKNGGRIAAEDEAKYYVRIPNPGKD